MQQVTIITNAEMVRTIKRYLRREGMTAATLARAIGVNYQQFHDMLAGRTPITPKVGRYFNFDRLDHVFAERRPRSKPASPQSRTAARRTGTGEEQG